jgi:maltodextrin utilization protein YvdJ
MLKNSHRYIKVHIRKNRQLGFPAKAESVSKSEVSDWIQKNRVYVAMSKDEVIGGVRLEVTDSEASNHPER